MLFNLEDLSEIVAKKLNISKSVIREINQFQWELAKTEFRNNEMKTVKIIYLGKFTKKLTNSDAQVNFFKKSGIWKARE